MPYYKIPEIESYLELSFFSGGSSELLTTVCFFAANDTSFGAAGFSDALKWKQDETLIMMKL